MENKSESSNPTLIHPWKSRAREEISSLKFLGMLIAVTILGTIFGFGAAKIQKLSKRETSQNILPKKKVGIADKKTFRDMAEGVLKEGGIDGEGNFHLERPGGESQNVYLTSSTVDLSLYVGKKVRVWGETFSAEKAGWLMDVGLVELLQ